MINNSLQKNTVITRFAPSPTGILHIGGVRTALFSYLFAKQHNGKTILRIEDTDKERSKKEYETDIIDSLSWLNLKFDETVRQSDREDIHTSYLRKMLTDGVAYVSTETPKEAGQRAEVIRFKNPNKMVTFTDLIRGKISFDTTELGDFVIAKSLTEPLFHLAVVVDDFEMGITHVIRGEDHISNTPRQILIQEAIGAPLPVYAHLPLILAPDRSKLSKRKHGESVSLTHYKNLGYLPEALINFVALLGWNPGTEKELFSIDELIHQFDISRVQKGGAVLNVEKLNWINKEYIKILPDSSITVHLKKAFPNLSEQTQHNLVPVIRDRITTFGDISTLAETGEFDYLLKTPTIIAEKLLWKKDPSKEHTKDRLRQTADLLSKISSWTKTDIESTLHPFAEKEGRGEVLWPIRYALTGKDKSPDPFTVAFLLGKETTLARLALAIKALL